MVQSRAYNCSTLMTQVVQDLITFQQEDKRMEPKWTNAPIERSNIKECETVITNVSRLLRHIFHDRYGFL